jgi:hypothetical protein
MKKIVLTSVLISFFLLFAISFSLTSSPALAQIQPPSHTTFDDNGNYTAPNLPNLKFNNLKAVFNDSTCPKEMITVSVSWPAGSGNEELDSILKTEALETLLSVVAADSSFVSQEKCPSPGGEEDRFKDVRLMYSATAASKDTLSLVWTYFEADPNAAHPNTTYRTENYLLSYLRPLEKNDVFPDPVKSLPLLWSYLAENWCAYGGGHPQMPDFYGLQNQGDCSDPKKIPIPSVFEAPGTPLSQLGNPYFTSEGLGLILGPYEGWSYADGVSTLTIEKDVLIKMGADPNFWLDK